MSLLIPDGYFEKLRAEKEVRTPRGHKVYHRPGETPSNYALFWGPMPDPPRRPAQPVPEDKGEQPPAEQRPPSPAPTSPRAAHRHAPTVLAALVDLWEASPDQWVPRKALVAKLGTMSGKSVGDAIRILVDQGKVEVKEDRSGRLPVHYLRPLVLDEDCPRGPEPSHR
jgi:hypothetical protein